MTDSEGKRRIPRSAIWIAGGVLALLVFLLLASVRPLAPRKIDILTGPKGSGYHALGQRFAARLERLGITARVVETNGALDNLERIAASDGPTVGFAQSEIERGLADKAAIEGVESLGSLAFQPLWLFVRDEASVTRVSDLAGRTVALGPKGSGSRAIAELLLAANGVKDDVTTADFDELVEDEAIDALLSGKLDAVFLVGNVEAPTVARLVRADGVSVVPIERTKAYAALYPGLARFEVPAGAFDLGQDLPSKDLEMIAATTNMVASGDLHSAMVEALIDTARHVHSGPSIEAPAGSFPSTRYVSLPINSAAQRFYDEGPSRMSRVLPYWASALVDQIVFVVIPILAIVFSLLKIVPLVLGLRFTLRNLSLCRKMVAIEHDLIAGKDSKALSAAVAEIDRASADMHVPPSKSSAYLELRQNIHDARERIGARGS